ncbi:hypothetical protein ACKI2N_032115 [Cupriavidus sp. 30B13]|uniref:hypothetical protein n=1 Tax=Cupriavidus sp. 30B13 TaxID=3384241 RepID=UPI003B911E48
MLTTLAQELTVTVAELVGEATSSHHGKRGPASRLQQQMDAISQLPKAQQKFVSQMLETVLAQHAR